MAEAAQVLGVSDIKTPQIRRHVAENTANPLMTGRAGAPDSDERLHQNRIVDSANRWTGGKYAIQHRSTEEVFQVLFYPQKKHRLIRLPQHRTRGFYNCPHCIRKKLVRDPQMAWYEYFLMLILLRFWRCPHCFHRFIRGII